MSLPGGVPNFEDIRIDVTLSGCEESPMSLSRTAQAHGDFSLPSVVQNDIVFLILGTPLPGRLDTFRFYLIAPV